MCIHVYVYMCVLTTIESGDQGIRGRSLLHRVSKRNGTYQASWRIPYPLSHLSGPFSLFLNSDTFFRLGYCDSFLSCMLARFNVVALRKWS